MPDDLFDRTGPTVPVAGANSGDGPASAPNPVSVLGDLNFRDLGGLPAGGAQIRPGVLFRSEGPSNFLPHHAAAIGSLGIRTICDLRSQVERDASPHAWRDASCRWRGLSVNADLRVFGHEGRERLIRGPDPQIAIDTMVETYREIAHALVPHWQEIAEIFLNDEAPVLVNCTAGKDRTGLVVAILLEVAGVPRDAIMDDYLRSGIFGENLRRGGNLEAAFRASYGFVPSAYRCAPRLSARGLGRD